MRRSPQAERRSAKEIVMPDKNEIQTLVEEAAASGSSLDRLRGIAFYDTEKDAPLTSLKSFGNAERALIRIPNFAARIGAHNAKRVVLQFVYQYFARVDNVRYEEAVFKTLWEEFTAEIANPQWVTRGIANVRNFTSENLLLDLGDGIAIRGRSFKELASLGFSQAILDRISEDWGGFGASSFVLVAEDCVLKTPDNVIALDSSMWTKAIRAVGACRLASAGSISIGPMWVARVARFNFGMGGISQVGVSIPSFGSRYVWSGEVAAAYPRIYRELAELEKRGYGTSPGNLAVALSAFMATYDRWPYSYDSQLLDSITALEALLGTETEIAFKLAFRVAALLAPTDKERGELLKLMKDFYDTRSKLVHGAGLREKHHHCLEQVDKLRSLVRQLLRSFVAFAVNPPEKYNKAFFNEHLDTALVNATERESLRAALGLIGPPLS
jgi:hypothetical protein